MDCMYSPCGRKESDTTARLSPVAQMVKTQPAMQETWVCSLGQEDPLEKGMAAHSSVLAWRIPWHIQGLMGYSHGVAKGWTQLSN